MSYNKITSWFKEIMTVIAFMKESDDSLLLAADSQLTGAYGNPLIQSKLRKVHDQQIVWSSAGNPSIGLDEFGNWLNTYNFTGKSWDLFANDAINKLSELNGAQRGRTKLSGAEGKEGKFVASVLIAGWIAGEAGAYSLSDDGRFTNILQYGFESMGSGYLHAHVALRVMQIIGNTKDKESVLKVVMKAATELAPDCLPPIEAWRLTKGAIKPAFKLEVELKDKRNLPQEVKNDAEKV